jgi:hypothetical protein
MHYWLLPRAETMPEKLSNLFLMLLGAVGDRLRPDHPWRLDAPLGVRIQARLWRIKKRIATLLARIEAGTLRPPRPSKPRQRPPRPDPQGPVRGPGAGAAAPRLPTHQAWLNRLVRPRESEASVVATVRNTLAQMLRSPELAALIGQHPRLAEAFRPLCRMVGVDPGLLPPRPPGPPRSPRPGRPKRPAPPPPDPKPPQRDGVIGPGSLLWSGAKPLAKGFRIRDWDVPRSKDKEAKFLRRVRL